MHRLTAAFLTLAALALPLAPAPARADGENNRAIILDQYLWSAEDGYTTQPNYFRPPASGCGFMMYNPVTQMYECAGFGQNFTFDSFTHKVEISGVNASQILDASDLGVLLVKASSSSAARTSLGLGTSATTAASAYATATQGGKADTAVQPAGLTWANVASKPSFATVATSGSYTDLSNKPTALTSLAVNNTPARSIVTAINAANGFQPHATKYSDVGYSITIQANATGLIAGASSGYVVMETCTTNSATGTDWKEIGRWGNGQSFTSILTLSSQQPITSDVRRTIQAGNWLRLRSVDVAGTPTYTFVSGQEVQPPQ